MRTLTRVHDPELPRALADAEARGGGWLDPDTYLVPGSLEAARLAAGRHDPGGARGRCRATRRWRSRPSGRPATMRAATGGAASACSTTSRSRSAALRAAGAARAGRDRRLGRPPRRRNAGDLRRRSRPLYTSTHQYPFYPGHRRRGRRRRGRRRDEAQPSAARRRGGRGLRRGLEGRAAPGDRGVRARRRSSSRPATTRTRPTRWRSSRSPRPGFEEVARLARRDGVPARAARRRADARGRLRPRRAPRVRGGHRSRPPRRPGVGA